MLKPLFNPILRYTKWLHTRWPAGHVEKLPVVQPDGGTNVPGLYVVGDLTGIRCSSSRSTRGPGRSARSLMIPGFSETGRTRRLATRDCWIC